MNQPISLAGTPAASPLGYYSWVFAHLARDPVYILIIIYIFLPYLSNTVIGDPVRGQATIGYVQSLSAWLVALTIPFLGAIADKDGRRKPWVIGTAIAISLASIGLWWVTPQQGLDGVTLGLVLLFVIYTAFPVSEVFHNAMLPSIVPANKAGLISGLGFSSGNMSGLVLMLFVLFAFAMPGVQPWSFLPDEPWFGIDQSLFEHDRLIGPLCGIWILIFTLPVLFFTPDGEVSSRSWKDSAKEGVRDLFETIRQVRHYANIARYLLARMLYNDGMAAVLTFAGIYASGVFGWGSIELLIFGLLTSFSAMIGAWLGGLLDDWLGSLRTLRLVTILNAVALISLVSVTSDTVLFLIPVSTEPVWDFPYFSTVSELYVLANNQFFALVFVTNLGASRTLMARISPPEMTSQFFALFGLSSTVTLFVGPLLVATITDITESTRLGVGSLAILIIAGSLVLLSVKDERSQKATAIRV